MAFLIPDNLKSRPDVPAGIRRAASAFEVALDENATVWFEPPFDPSGDKPHLIVLLPDRGILVLEALEVQRGKILGAFRGKVRIVRDDREVEVDNPIKRAKHLAKVLTERIAAESRLGGVKIPIAAGAIFPSTSRKEAQAKGLADVMPLDKCLFKPDFDSAIDGEGEAQVTRVFAKMLGKSAQIASDKEKILRGIIQPEIVIDKVASTRSEQLAIFRPPKGDEDIVRVMDRKQEAMAKSLGQGHRVIRGVAGSGKTLVLVYRAKLLATIWPNQPILVTCYTRSLAGQLRYMLQEYPNVTVNNLDRLMSESIRSAGLSHPGYEDDDTGELVAQTALKALGAGHSDRYRVVLIDEAQDFGTTALKYALALLEDRSDDLLVVADAAQNIFRRRSNWKQAGIQAQGRTQILRVNYRNTKEILEFAYNFLLAGGTLIPKEVPDLEDENMVIPPQSAARSGDHPIVHICRSTREEIDSTIRQVRGWIHSVNQSKSVAVLYPSSLDGSEDKAESLYRGLLAAGVSTYWLTPTKRYRDYSAKDRLSSVEDLVVLSTVQSAKGLEFPFVVLSGLWSEKHDTESNRALAYVGMTRAANYLTVVSRDGHPLADDLKKVM